MGDALSDFRGESLFVEEEEPPPSSGILADGIGALRDIILGAQSSVVTVFTGGQDTVESVLLGGQQTVGTALQSGQAATERILNPFGLFGIGAGLTFGGTLALVGVVGGAALIADEVVAGGAGRTALMRRVSGRKR